MTLTTDQMITIMTEQTLGKPPTVKGSEADEFRRELAEDVAKIKDKGGIVDIPHEWGVE